MTHVVPTDAPPHTPARKVGEKQPDLLQSEEHHLCPGCGEPVALRILLETIRLFAAGRVHLDGRRVLTGHLRPQDEPPAPG